MYVCVKCKQECDAEERVRCLFCGFRILVKKRPVFRKRVLAR